MSFKPQRYHLELGLAQHAPDSNYVCYFEKGEVGDAIRMDQHYKATL